VDGRGGGARGGAGVDGGGRHSEGRGFMWGGGWGVWALIRRGALVPGTYGYEVAMPEFDMVFFSRYAIVKWAPLCVMAAWYGRAGCSRRTALFQRINGHVTGPGGQN
jgi:hypothetical protein